MGGGVVRIYNNKLDILLSSDCIKVILRYFFFPKNEIKKKTPMGRVEPGAFESVVSSLPMELLENISTVEYLINIKMENMFYGLWEKSSNFSAGLPVHNIFHLVR